MNTKFIFTTTGKSLLELRREYGTVPQGFYDNSWWLEETFAKENPPAGTYEIDFGEHTTNKTFEEQKQGLEKEFDVIHPAILVEALFLHFKKTGEKLLSDYWFRTSSLTSVGGRVHVRFSPEGLSISVSWGGHRDGGLGLASVRKLKMTVEVRTLEPFKFSPFESAVLQELQGIRLELAKANKIEITGIEKKSVKKKK